MNQVKRSVIKKSIIIALILLVALALSLLMFPRFWFRITKPFGYKLHKLETHLSQNDLNADIHMIITSNYFTDIMVDSVNYNIQLDSTSIGRGSVKLDQLLGHGETDTLILGLTIDRTNLEKKKKALEGDSTMLHIDFNHYADLWLVGPTDFCLVHEQKIPPPSGPKVSILKVEKIKLGFKEASFRVYYDFYNPSSRDLEINKIHGQIDFPELFSGTSYIPYNMTLKAKEHTYFNSVMQLEDVQLLKDGFNLLTHKNQSRPYHLEVNMKLLKDDNTEMSVNVMLDNVMVLF